MIILIITKNNDNKRNDNRNVERDDNSLKSFSSFIGLKINYEVDINK